MKRMRRLFSGYMLRKDLSTMNKPIFDKIICLSCLGGRAEQIKEEFGRLGIANEDGRDKNRFGDRLSDMDVLVVEMRERRGRGRTGERRAIWSKRKKQPK